MIRKLSGQFTRIKSVQRGTITVADGSISNTATITEVVVANCDIQMLGLSTTSTNTQWSSRWFTVKLTNSTTITVARGSGSAGNGVTIVSYELTEYAAGSFKSRQAGVIAQGTGTSATATVTAVDMSNSILRLNGVVDGAAATEYEKSQMKAVLTNSTTITISRGANGADGDVAYQLLEGY